MSATEKTPRTEPTVSGATDYDDSSRFESFRNHITVEHHPVVSAVTSPTIGATSKDQSPPSAERLRAPTFIVESRLTVSASWMRSSFENAQSRLPVQDFPVKGFRPGKAPRNLIEKKRAERAFELARGWVIDDLRRFLGESLEVLMIETVGAPLSVDWLSPETALTAIFRYEGWIYPQLDVAALCRHIGPGEHSTEELAERVREYTSSGLIPPGIEHALMRTEEMQHALTDETATAGQHIRQALANTTLAMALGIEVTSEDLDKMFGAYAIEHSLSFLEAKDELTPVMGVYIQKIETEKTYTRLRELLAKMP